MAGTIYGLPLSQQFDINGDPLGGCLLYLYEATTSTPVDSFQDFALSVLNPWPLEADSSGRIPTFWLADGAYRSRLTTSVGVEVFDLDNIQALGPSTGGASGGGGSGVDADAVLLTGDFLWRPTAGTRTGFVRGNGRTIGSASSGATERANADTQALFEFLFNNFTNAECPVSGGRVGAAADFTANKTIGTFDMRGYGIFGLDDMGNSAAGRLVTGTPTTAASATGAEKTTIALVNLPSTDLSLGSVTVPLVGATNIAKATATNNDCATTGAGARFSAGLTAGNTITASLAGTLPLGGSGTAATTISPGRLGTWFIKL